MERGDPTVSMDLLVKSLLAMGLIKKVLQKPFLDLVKLFESIYDFSTGIV
jgi:hypothetical protein